MSEYYSIKEILKNTTLTRRLITLRVCNLKKIHPNLITGGNQGKKYKIHYSLLDNICKRKYSSNKPSNKFQEYKKRKEREEILFLNTKWTYFFSINTASDSIEDDFLINLIPKTYFSFLFYSIHYSPNKVKENRHIHFVIKSSMNIVELRKQIKEVIGNLIAEVFVDYFDNKLVEQCYNYMTNDKPILFGKPSQKVSSYGLIEGDEISTISLHH